MMQVRRKNLPVAAAVTAFAGLMSVALVTPAIAQVVHPPQAAKGETAGHYYKNVTTATLKELSPSDFLGAMGVMTAALGYDCSNCHPGAGTDAMDWVTDKDRKKVIARKMVDMVASINKANFAGAQSVTCFTCHHGLDLPVTSIQLDKLYGEPPDEKRDIVPIQKDEPPATQILDEYIQAMGGAQKLAGLKSYIATGVSVGYAGVGGNGNFQIFAEAPNRRGMWINFPEHPDRGIGAWTYNGTTGYISQPRAYMGTWELDGFDLQGAKLDAILAFPGGIKSAFPNWRVGPEDILHDRDVYVVQGSAPGGLVGTFYFDKKTHLLTRYVRLTPSPVGRISIQQDFADYRDVNGIKFPFQYSFLWLDGRFTANIKEVKVNVPVDAAKVGKP